MTSAVARTATRAVVIGPYPPTADPLGDAVLDRVRRMRAEGVTVAVVSPVPSAAASHGRPDTVTGAVRIARAVRGTDLVVWFTDGDGHRGAAWPLRRALATVPRVECVVRSGQVAPVPDERRAMGARLARARAGAPTLVRSLSARVRRSSG